MNCMTTIMRPLFVAVLGLVLATPASHAQTAAPSATKAHVEFLASDKLEGREAGSPGERLAAEYLTAQLTRIGARPLPGRSDMFMPFEFTAGSRGSGSRITVTAGAGPASTFSAPRDIQALSFSDEANVSGPVVFAGYGLVVPESQNLGYDSYAAREERRATLQARPDWQAFLARIQPLIHTQQNRILVPTSFSPLA